MVSFGAQQLKKHENELLGLCQVGFVSPAHLFAENGDELYFPLDYAV